MTRDRDGSPPVSAGASPDERPGHRPGPRRIPWPELGAIAAGGIIGALARQGLWTVFPRAPAAFDWTTLGINTAGCALIGVLMTAVPEAWRAPRLTRPFLGVGVLGGFTTFSTYIIDIQRSITAGAPLTGLAYLAATLAAALLAVYAGVMLTRLIGRPHRIEGYGAASRIPTSRTGRHPRRDKH